MLERSDVKDRIRVEHHLNGWPKDPKALEDANTIVVISDGRDGDKYSDALHLQSKERVAEVDRLMKRGCGLVLIHFSNFAPEQFADDVLRWVGGYFKWETDGKKQWYSAIKTIEAEVTPLAAEHPVLRGIKPFRMKEEFYYNLRFAPAENGMTPLLGVNDLKGRAENGNVVAWAMQRPADAGNGRGFATTCGHFYDNWKNDAFRKTVLNGIVWSAGVEVPREGVNAPYIAREEVKP
jgi:type 1 glutamine amidotransferase